MAITIRNKETEAMIRRLGRRWGLGPSGVVRRLAEERLGEADTVSEEEFQQRMAAWDEIMKLAPEFTEEEKERMRYEMDHMFDYLDEDEEPGDSQAAE